MAGNLNKVMLIGHLGRDPEIRYTKDGTAVANLRIATSEQWTDKAGEKQEKTEWHTVVLWSRQAEIANEYLQKGSLIYVEGRLETRKWQDQAGADRYTTEIRGQMFQMLGPRGGGGGERSSERGQDEGGEAPRRSGPPRTGSAPPRRPNPASSAAPPDDDQGPPPEDDDIPF